MAADPSDGHRRAFLGRVASLGIGASFFPSVVGSKTGENNLRLGYLPITDAAPLLIAHALGFFKEQGLIVQRPTMVRSWNVLTEAFLAGKFDLTHMLFPIPVWMRFKQKIPVKVLAWDHTNGSAVTVGGASDIRGFKDLGGKSVAVPSWYSMHNIILQMGIIERGLTPVIRTGRSKVASHEVNLFVLQPPDMPASLAGRKMDGFIVAEPFNALAELKIKARIMRFTGDIWKNHPCCVIVANENIVEKKPVAIQKAVNAIVRAQDFCRNNRGKTAHILSREGEGYLPVSEKVLKRVFMGYDFKEYISGIGARPVMHPEWNSSRIDFQPYPFNSTTEMIIRNMAKTRVEGDNSFLQSLDPSTASRELVDDSFVIKAIEEAGGFGRFYPRSLEKPYFREEIIEID